MGGPADRDENEDCNEINEQRRPAGQDPGRRPFGRITADPTGGQGANTWSSSAKALNSRALPAGSRTNIVHCSPG
jgi:hypothetical protein